MGSNSHSPAPVDPQALNNAKDLWNNFTKMIVIGVAGVVITLGLMALFLV